MRFAGADRGLHRAKRSRLSGGGGLSRSHSWIMRRTLRQRVKRRSGEKSGRFCSIDSGAPEDDSVQTRRLLPRRGRTRRSFRHARDGRIVQVSIGWPERQAFYRDVPVKAQRHGRKRGARREFAARDRAFENTCRSVRCIETTTSEKPPIGSGAPAASTAARRAAKPLESRYSRSRFEASASRSDRSEPVSTARLARVSAGQRSDPVVCERAAPTPTSMPRPRT